MVPHSRHTVSDEDEIRQCPYLKVLASSKEAGIYCVSNQGARQIFVTGHSEYDKRTLEKEYLRDKNKGLPIEVPKNYYPDNDDTKEPIQSWRSSANLLYSNWLNYIVYQMTPYKIDEIPPLEKKFTTDVVDAIE